MFIIYSTYFFTDIVYFCLQHLFMAIQPPKIPSFFHVPQHRQFDYTPVFYDKEAEDQEKRKKEAELETGIKEIEKESLHEGLDKFRTTEKRSKNIRLLIILGIMCCVIYFLSK